MTSEEIKSYNEKIGDLFNKNTKEVFNNKVGDNYVKVIIQLLIKIRNSISIKWVDLIILN
jgi:hypothetical protein